MQIADNAGVQILFQGKVSLIPVLILCRNNTRFITLAGLTSALKDDTVCLFHLTKFI